MRKAHILLVDDDNSIIEHMRLILQDYYRVSTASSGVQAIRAAMSQDAPDLIILDVLMPSMDGIETCMALKNNALTRHIPVIFLTGIEDQQKAVEGFAVGAADYIQKPINKDIVRARVNSQLRLFNEARHLEELVQERLTETVKAQGEVIQCLNRICEQRDYEPVEHTIRVSKYTGIIAKHYGLKPEIIEILKQASKLHDIGKVYLPDRLLGKVGKLSDEEREEMKKHTVYGEEILADGETTLMRNACQIAGNHHERWDGKGYPRGTSDTDIPLAARMVALSDVFDALTSVRPHKKAWALNTSLAYIRKEKNAHFDPQVVDAFERGLNEIKTVYKTDREKIQEEILQEKTG